MMEDIIIEPMTEEFILWRCLHSGPLSRDTIDQWPSESQIPWERYRQRNTPLLLKLTQTYGACAILARDQDRIVGTLRFYPRAVCDMEGDGLCLQQDNPSGPVDDCATHEFPTLEQIEDKTLVIHCLMIGSSQQKENPYQRKGIGSRMVKALIQWAANHEWHHIEVDAFEDLPIIYEITGSAGHTFWEKLGFSIIDRYPHPHLQEPGPFVQMLEEQARSVGVSPEQAKDKIVMRFNLI
ncbi:MAG: GNAT family N-acetyltransferase [Sedimentisphaerales bacterium]|nr:GNAT family N-acetyltransferase [Sedimentisphaerales bacterium]